MRVWLGESMEDGIAGVAAARARFCAIVPSRRRQVFVRRPITALDARFTRVRGWAHLFSPAAGSGNSLCAALVWSRSRNRYAGAGGRGTKVLFC